MIAIRYLPLHVSALAEDRHPLPGQPLVPRIGGEVDPEGQRDSLRLVIDHLFGPLLLDDAVHSRLLVSLHDGPGQVVEVELQRQLDPDRPLVFFLVRFGRSVGALVMPAD